MTRATALRVGDAAERVRALADLAAPDAIVEPDALDALVDCLADARKIVQRRAAETCVALLDRHAELRARLHGALGADDPRMRWGAAYALGLATLFSEDTVRVLTEALGGHDGDLRWAALDLFKRFGATDPAAAGERLVRLAVDGNTQQRKMALYGLRDLAAADAAAVDAATQALESRAAEVRLAAISLLVRLSAHRARTATILLGLLGDADPVIPRAAAAGLGMLGERSPEVLAALERVRSGPDPGLRRAAVRSLRLLSRREPRP